jgi:flagellar biosynthesis anti-sigma factor FlgM
MERTDMRINDLYKQLQLPAVSASKSEARPSASGAGRENPVGTAGVKLTLSSQAVELAAKEGTMDAAKIARLKQAIASGEHRVDARAIAARIVETET